jgi:hypothetical protein
MPLVLKMATPQHRNCCVLQLENKESVTTVHRAFRTQFHMEPPSQVFIYAWYKKSRKDAHQDSCLWKCSLSAWISCTRRKWILGWVVPCEIMWEMWHVSWKLHITGHVLYNTFDLFLTSLQLKLIIPEYLGMCCVMCSGRWKELTQVPTGTKYAQYCT